MKNVIVAGLMVLGFTGCARMELVEENAHNPFVATVSSGIDTVTEAFRVPSVDSPFLACGYTYGTEIQSATEVKIEILSRENAACLPVGVYQCELGAAYQGISDAYLLNCARSE